MTMSEGGEKDSQGQFTLAASKSVERLREQFSGDLSLGFVELIEGFQEQGATRVEICSEGIDRVDITGYFPDSDPDMSALFSNPLGILEAQTYLHSGTGLILLEHVADRVSWTRRVGRSLDRWDYQETSGYFEAVDQETTAERPSVVPSELTWTLRVFAKGQLALFSSEARSQWEGQHLSVEFASRLAFSSLSLTFNGKLIQCPLPGRLAQEDHWRRSSSGVPGYNWIPLALQYRASRESSHGFLSEPFTGVIADAVLVDGELAWGFGSGSFPDFVSLISVTGSKECSTVPFQVRRFFGARKLRLPGFRAMHQPLIHPRMDGGLTRVHCKGPSLICSEILMLSTALVGPSTLVFMRHGVVLGAVHEDLGVRGSVCLVDASKLKTDLSRRNVRKDENYKGLLKEVRQNLLAFAHTTWKHLSPKNPFREALAIELRREPPGD